MISVADLKAALHYDPDTGVFTWISSTGPRAVVGVTAGTTTMEYVWIKLHGRTYAAHVLAWFYMTGEWPSDQVDHRDGDTRNNRWGNLREATPQQNSSNRKVRYDSPFGITGVYASGKKFIARINAGGEQIHLGTFDTVAEAANARAFAARDIFGEFARAL
jgi:hypothetical protein